MVDKIAGGQGVAPPAEACGTSVPYRAPEPAPRFRGAFAFAPRVVSLNEVQIAEKIRADVNSAMKAGEKDRVQALRLVLSELQKAAKEGAGDELAGRCAASASAVSRPRRPFATAAATSSPTAEEREAALIEAYLPAELSDDELRGDRRRGGRRDRRRSRRRTWACMKAVMARVGGRADGKRVSARVQGGAAA